MLIIADKKIPDKALFRLEQYGKVISLETKGITYPAISGHADIFFCQTGNHLVVAPDTPLSMVEKLKKANIRMIFWEKTVGPVLKMALSEVPAGLLRTTSFLLAALIISRKEKSQGLS